MPPEKKEEAVVKSVYSIQAGAFKNMENAESIRDMLAEELGRPVVIEEAEGFYKVLIPGFDRWKEAVDYMERVISLGFPGAFIHKNE
jgi:cell division protein FtsN